MREHHVASLVLLLLPLLSLLHAAQDEEMVGHFINRFAVEVEGGREVAEAVARDHGFQLVREIPELENMYRFQHSSVSHRSKRSAEHLVTPLRTHPNVKFVEQQKVLGRYKRSPVRYNIVHNKHLEPFAQKQDRDQLDTSSHDRVEKVVPLSDMGIEFNDPQFPRMWYLINKGQTGGPEGLDVNVLPVWKKNITGRGVVVSILDDGVDHKHKDLEGNYDPRASADFNDESDIYDDPTPEGNLEENSHGTKCAGEVAAIANNNLDGLGIAFNAKIGGVRMLDGLITDEMEGRALMHAKDYIDIYSASWGPNDDGKTMDKPGTMANRALETGIREGRNGKGALYVWATGNGGGNGDDCNCDGYVSSIYTISIGCINDEGLSTYFSEICPSTLAVILTGGPHTTPDDPDYRNPPIKVITVDVGGDDDRYTDQFMGTSAAAPLAAGLFALVLEANRNLTWRDVQYLVVETSNIPNPKEDGWTLNGGGYHVNHRFGFGSLDAGRMVEAAQNWVTVPEQRSCDVEADNKEIRFNAGETKKQTLRSTGCHGHVDRLEHVQVHVDLEHHRRGDLSIYLVSPHGTRSQVLSPRPKDDSTQGVRDWTFMTVHNWGEDPKGDWTLEVSDVSDSSSDSDSSKKRSSESSNKPGRLLRWSLTLYGVRSADYGDNKNSGHHSGNSGLNSKTEGSGVGRAATGEEEAHVADSNEVQEIMDKEQEDSDSVHIQNNEDATRDEEVEKKDDDDEFLDALAEIFMDEELSQERKRAYVKKATKSDDDVKQHVRLRNLQRRLEEEKLAREEEKKKEEEEREQEELRELIEEILLELEES